MDSLYSQAKPSGLSPSSVSFSWSPTARCALLQLWCMANIGPKTLQSLLPFIIEGWRPGQALDPARIMLRSPQLKALAHRKNQGNALQRAEQILAWEAQSDQHTLCLIGDAHYPPLLAEINAPPAVLMVKGVANSLSKIAISMVGSRNPSLEGKKNARLFSEYLVHQGAVIISGGAAGVDRICHEAAIGGGGQTVAVLGHSLDKCYPASHQQLFEAITEKGALVSEFPLGTSPRPQYFPRRNRIITGLSFGVCVVEAGLPSGSLVSARWAYEQNREVFAIPGSIHNPRAKGCHMLIQQGAKLVQSGDDILSELQHVTAFVAQHQSLTVSACEPQAQHLPEDASIETQIAFHLAKKGLLMDELAPLMPNMSIQALSSCLTLMEIDGRLRRDASTGLFTMVAR